jgi:hypothetical protein
VVVVLLALTVAAPATAGEPDPTYLPELLEAARREALHADRQWTRLLHYRRNLFGRLESQVDGKSFFLSPDGKHDAKAELEATLAAFFAPLPDADPHAQCRFPARLLWLGRRLHIDPARLPARSCPEWEDFRGRLDAKSATLVFSSYYLNNPSSAFGHTFMRVSRADGAAGVVRSDLLDYGIDYAAVVTTSSAVIYAFEGIFGGFEGHFSHYPYYFKIRQYNDYETRDIWEYDLDLTPEQVAMLVAHFWELGQSWFDYYYLTENCSFHMLTALEVANPDLDLVDQIPFWVIPADTVKALYTAPGLVKAVRYRPSIWTQFKARVAALVPEDRARVKRLAGDGGDLPADLPPERRMAILDAALDYVDFRDGEGILEGRPEPVARKRRLLTARSAIRTASPDLAIAPPYDRMPQVGHDSARAGLAFGWSDDLGPFERLDFRFALHDLTDPEVGYPDYAQIEFFSTRLRYNSDPETLWLERFDAVRVVSLSPVTTFNRQFSWKIGFGAKTIRDESCRDCLAASFDLGAGYALTLLDRPRVVAFAMADMETVASPRLLDHKFRLGVGPLGGLHARVGRRLSLLATGAWRYLVDYDPERTYEYSVTAKVHLTDWLSLGVEGSRVPNAWEGALGAYLYF